MQLAHAGPGYPVTPNTTPDGVNWLQLDLNRDDPTGHYMSLPGVLTFEGRSYAKVSYNTDSWHVTYRDNWPIAR